MSESAIVPGEEQPSFAVTSKARDRVLGLRDDEENPETLALWVEVIGSGGPDLSYDMYFEAKDKAGPSDLVLDHDDLPVIIPEDSIAPLKGAQLDVSRDLLNPGLVMTNPNESPRPESPSMGTTPDALTGETPEKITRVLEEQINPSIAAHGGRAELVAVEDDVVYLRLSGGCQGCGMASVTLSQGIETAIRESVPDITQVVDVTDHASGTNPYYEAAKK